MDEQLKRRLIGATVLTSLAIIFLPMLLTHKPVTQNPGGMQPIPQEPPRKFDASLLEDDTQHNKVAETTTLLVAPKPKPEPEVVKPQSAPAVVKPKPATVKKPAPKKTPKPLSAAPSAWVVQAASLSSLSSARKLVKKLRKAGFDTMEPKAVTVKGKRYYRVQVGPEINRKRAQRMLPRIKKVTGVKGQVVRYP